MLGSRSSGSPSVFDSPERASLPMTVGVCISCSDGIVLACDSLTTFGRGVPVLKYSNKVHVLEHEGLAFPVAIEAAGVTTFFDKFRDRALRTAIDQAFMRQGQKLDVIDFEA